MLEKLKKLMPLFLITFISVVFICGCDSMTSHVHEYGEWIETKESTCTEAGEKVRYCSCGDTQVRTLSIQEHTYSAWEVTKEATCTEKGEEIRHCVYGHSQTREVPVKAHAYGEWIVSKEATCGQSGEKYAICSSCNDKKIKVIDKSLIPHSYTETVTKKPTCTERGEKILTCSVCADEKVEPIYALGHNVGNNNKCSTCGLLVLKMTDTEIEKSKQVKSMSYSASEYSDEIIISIKFKDDDSYNVQIPVYVEIKIVDETGREIYNETIIKKASQDKINIDYSKLKKAYTNTGTLSYRVYNDYVSFEACVKELLRIPWTVDVELPSLPKEIVDSGYGASICKVTGITYVVSGDNITFYFTGEKTYDAKGNRYSQSCKIGWKLYDSDGYVVDAGTCYTNAIHVGEKFKNADITAYDVIEQGMSYRLVLLDVD